MAEKTLIERFDKELLDEAKKNLVKNARMESLDFHWRASYARTALTDIDNLVAMLDTKIAENTKERDEKYPESKGGKEVYDNRKRLNLRITALEKEKKSKLDQRATFANTVRQLMAQADEAMDRADFIESNFPEKVLASNEPEMPVKIKNDREAKPATEEKAEGVE